MDTALLDIQPKIWKSYIDGSFEVVRKTQLDTFREHLNSIDAMGSMFSYEPEMISHKDESSITVQVNCKNIHHDASVSLSCSHNH